MVRHLIGKWFRLSAQRELTPYIEQRLVLVFSRPSPDPECVRSLIPLLPQANWMRVKDLAVAHRVAGLVHSNLVQCRLESAIPLAIRHELLEVRRSTLARNLDFRQAWQVVMDAFAEANIEVIALKGMHLISRLLPPDVRPFYDIDLLVKKPKVERASRRLMALGYQPLPNLLVNGQTWYTQRSFRDPATKIVIDLHWDLINIYTYQPIYALPIEQIWERARAVGVPHCLYDMAPEDLVLHTAFHCAIHHTFGRLSHFADLTAILQVYGRGLDWQRLVQLATVYRAKSSDLRDARPEQATA